MEFIIEVTETLSRQIRVQSTSVKEAYQTVIDLYRKEEIVLDSSDFVCSEFSVINEGRNALCQSYE